MVASHRHFLVGRLVLVADFGLESSCLLAGVEEDSAATSAAVKGSSLASLADMVEVGDADTAAAAFISLVVDTGVFAAAGVSIGATSGVLLTVEMRGTSSGCFGFFMFLTYSVVSIETSSENGPLQSAWIPAIVSVNSPESRSINHDFSIGNSSTCCEEG